MAILIKKIYGDPLILPIDKTILIEDTFKEMRITLSNMKGSVYTIDITQGPAINKNDKTTFLFFFAKMANFAKDKKENFYHFFYRKRLIFDSLKRDRNPFSISCLVCTTELTQYTT